jgi:hypothetical protein
VGALSAVQRLDAAAARLRSAKEQRGACIDDIGSFLLHGLWIYLFNFFDDLFRTKAASAVWYS